MAQDRGPSVRAPPLPAKCSNLQNPCLDRQGGFRCPLRCVAQGQYHGASGRRICDFGEVLGRREASASSQPVVPGAGLFRAPGSLVSKIHSGGLRAVTATATNLHAQLRELNRLRDQVRKAKLSARESRRVPQKKTHFENNRRSLGWRPAVSELKIARQALCGHFAENLCGAKDAVTQPKNGGA